MSVLPAKTEISLDICLVWSESSLCAQWVAKDPRFLHVDRCPGWSESSLGTHEFCHEVAHFLQHQIKCYSLTTQHCPIVAKIIVMILSTRTDWSWQQCRSRSEEAVWSGSTLFATLSASFEALLYRKTMLLKYLANYKNIFRWSQYLGFLWW